MNNTFLDNYDWKAAAMRKLASQQPEPDTATDDKDTEAAFCEQAQQFVANKLPQLFRNPYRLGFEVIKMNDDKTRLCGTYAFNTGKDIVYAPVFFINGKIKGDCLCYLHGTKKFVPATPAWAEYLISKSKKGEGKMLDRTQTARFTPKVYLDKLTSTPAIYKNASEKEQLWGDFNTVKSLRPILREFMIEDGQMEAIDKIAAWMDQDMDFAESLLQNCDDATWFPEQEILAKIAHTKQASAKVEDVKDHLEIYRGVFPESMDDSEKEMFFKWGFLIRDKRKADASYVYVDDLTQKYESVTSPGEYNVLMSDGDYKKCFVAPYEENRIRSYRDNYHERECDDMLTCGPLNYSARPANKMAVVVLDSKETTIAFSKSVMVATHALEDLSSRPEGSTHLKDSVSEGKAYRLYNPKGGSLSDPFYVSKTESAGESSTLVYFDQTYGSTFYTSESDCNERTSIFKINKEWSGCDLKKGILGKDCKFIEVKIESDGKDRKKIVEAMPTMSSADFSQFIYNNVDTIKKASIHYKPMGGNFSIEFGGAHSAELDPFESVIKLAHGLGMTVNDSLDMIEKAKREGTSEFLVELGKSAYATKLVEEPEYQRYFDDDLRVTVQVPESFTLNTETPTSQTPDPRLGDHYDNRLGWGPISKDGDGLRKEVLMSKTPKQLAELGEDMKLPHVFEHGLMGSLVDTFDSASMLDKYIPKLEDGVDAMGRILFLFYWKPQDFEQMFGADSQDQNENKFTSGFKMLGDILLTLMKKSRQHAGDDSLDPNT